MTLHTSRAGIKVYDIIGYFPQYQLMRCFHHGDLLFHIPVGFAVFAAGLDDLHDLVPPEHCTELVIHARELRVRGTVRVEELPLYTVYGGSYIAGIRKDYIHRCAHDELVQRTVYPAHAADDDIRTAGVKSSFLRQHSAELRLHRTADKFAVNVLHHPSGDYVAYIGVKLAYHARRDIKGDLFVVRREHE